MHSLTKLELARYHFPMPESLSRNARIRSLWPLPLVAGLLPVIASVAAFWISVAQEYITACNPLVEGCVSISRAARHGLGNQVFRALILPAATLQAITWLLANHWLTSLGAGGRSMKWLAVLGVFAGVFLVLYASFLGSEGDAYRWLRRYGVIVYFGFTYMSMLIVAARLHHLVAHVGLHLPVRLDIALLLLLAAILLMGLFNYFARPMLADASARDRIENLLEWYSGLGFTVYFLALAWVWRRTGFNAHLIASR